VKVNLNVAGQRKINLVRAFAGFALALVLLAPLAVAQSESTDTKPAERKARIETYQTFYLNYATQPNDLIDVQTALRNVLPNVKVYSVPGQNAISMRATAEEFQTAQKIVADLDRPRKTYRLTFTITDTEGGKRTGRMQIVLIVPTGRKTLFRQGIKVPLVTGFVKKDGGALASESQVEYQDVGLRIEATVEKYADDLYLRSAVEQSSIAGEKSVGSAQDPVTSNLVLDGESSLALGKPLVLGSFDIPGGTRKQEIEVVAELVK
jgi:type II secretory pathway component GspD/PulD (secretin)